MPSVGARRHAEKAAAWGADAVMCRAARAAATRSVATTVLLPQVVDAVDIPVVAAGGFHDGRGLGAALIEDLPSVAGLVERVERVVADAARSLVALGAMSGRAGAREPLCPGPRTGRPHPSPSGD
ncbi:nitronate monooxygenase [Streptomyces globisporus]|uniref:nitronate monooxygenase n=1 Tax=Streptomyces globisporus TaxID=1908 RepID=UPI0036CE9AF8